MERRRTDLAVQVHMVCAMNAVDSLHPAAQRFIYSAAVQNAMYNGTCCSGESKAGRRTGQRDCERLCHNLLQLSLEVQHLDDDMAAGGVPVDLHALVLSQQI